MQFARQADFDQLVNEILKERGETDEILNDSVISFKCLNYLLYFLFLLLTGRRNIGYFLCL
jgi:hypothetical protein